MAINRAKLKDLDDGVLAGMVRNGEMDLIYMHLQSMQNFGAMVQRIGATPEAEAAALGDVADEPEADSAPS